MKITNEGEQTALIATHSAIIDLQKFLQVLHYPVYPVDNPKESQVFTS